MSNRAWVTLATNDSYGVGALVLAHSLRQVGSAYPAVVLITPSVTEVMRDRLSAVFAEVITVDVLDSQDAAHLALLQRPELGITFTKIHCWNLTQYEKCVFLDADVLVVQKCDELFEREELSAAPDVGWPDCFNTGVFVFCPSADTFSNLIKFAQERGSFDGGDQGLLNSFFSDWARGDSNKRLPFLYNVTSAAFYSYLPALKQYGQDLKIIHFIGAGKPWLQNFNWESRTVEAPEHLRQFLQAWWDLFIAQVHPLLDVSMTGVAGNLSRIVPGAPIQREAVDELTRRQGWETGNMDYMGADSFANIWAKISQTLSQPPSTPPKQSSPQKDQPPAASKTDKPLESSETKIEQQTVATVTSPIKQPTGKPDNESVLESASVEPSAKVEPVQTTVPPAVEEPIPIPVEAATVDAAPVPAQISQSTQDETESVATTELPVAAIEALKLGETVPNLPQTESVPVTETEPKVESVPTIASEPKIESVPIAEPKLKSVPITEPEPTVEPVPMAEPEPKLESKPIVTPEPKVESVPVVEPDAKVESEPKVESVPIVEATPTVQLETNVETQPKVESMTAVELSATKPAVESPIKESTIVPPASPPADKSLETESAVVSPTPASADKSPATEPADESFVSLPESEPAIELTTKESAETSPTLEPAVSTVPEPKDSDKTADISVSDSPPLANTPSKEDIPVAPVAKSSEEAAQETRL